MVHLYVIVDACEKLETHDFWNACMLNQPLLPQSHLKSNSLKLSQELQEELTCSHKNALKKQK